jgi:hypothetical protein
MTTTTLPLTVGQVARRLGAPIRRVQWAVDFYKIAPAGRAAHFRLYDEAAVEAIKREFDRIDSTTQSERAKLGWANHKARKQAAAQPV